MFEQMLNASRAVLLRPSVATFEEFERDDLGAATVYVLVGSIIASILGLIGFYLKRPFIEQQLRDAQSRLDGQFDFTGALAARGNPVSSIAGNLIGTLIGFFIFLGLVYLLGRAFGGTGTFGQLAYDTSLYWAPLGVITAFLDMIAIGPLSILTGVALFAAGIYNIYLTYLGIQSGMNLPPNRALIIVLIPFVLGLLACCLLVGGLAFLIGSQSQPQ